MKGYCRNEVTAREGIDTTPPQFLALQLSTGRNEVTAREGIDTTRSLYSLGLVGSRRNEVTAREGIKNNKCQDTKSKDANIAGGRI